VRRIAGSIFESWIGESESSAIFCYFTTGTDDHSLFQGLRDETLIEPDEAYLSACVFEYGFCQKHFSLPCSAGFDVDYFSFDGALFIKQESIYGTEF